jgi:hypothetical protein
MFALAVVVVGPSSAGLAGKYWRCAADWIT